MVKTDSNMLGKLRILSLGDNANNSDILLEFLSREYVELIHRLIPMKNNELSLILTTKTVPVSFITIIIEFHEVDEGTKILILNEKRKLYSKPIFDQLEAIKSSLDYMVNAEFYYYTQRHKV